MKFEIVIPWLRKHSKLVTFLGAVLVFATFIVKDVLREDSRDLLDSVESAQSIFLIRDGIIFIDDRTIQVENGVEYLIHREKDQTFSDQDKYKRLMRSAQWRIQDLDNSIDSIARFQEKIAPVVASIKLPQTGDLAKEAKSIKCKIEGFKTSEQEISKSEDPQDRGGKFQSLTTLMSSTISEEVELSRNVQNRAMETLNIAGQASLDAQMNYKHFTWWSYFLYIIGFLFGLFGQLLGVEGVRSKD